MQFVPVPAISAGDVLVSRSSARADLYEISVVPALASMKCTRYGEGMDAGRQLACRLGVGAWFTCNHSHFLLPGGCGRHTPPRVRLQSTLLSVVWRD